MPEVEILKLALEAVVQTGVGKFTEAGLAKGKQQWFENSTTLAKRGNRDRCIMKKPNTTQSETILDYSGSAVSTSGDAARSRFCSGSADSRY